MARARMRDDYNFLQLCDVKTRVKTKVNLIAVVFEYGFPKATRGTDYCCALRIIDETHHQTSMAVNIFSSNTQSLPLLAAVGDIIQLRHVVIKTHEGEVNAVFNKSYSSFALYKGKDGDDFAPYNVSSNFHPRDEANMLIDKLRKWLVDFQLHEDPSKFPMLREIKEGTFINWACKILHYYEATKDECLVFTWDGTNTPPNAICSNYRLGDEIISPLPLQLESSPLSRESLCSLPTVGSILRISFDQRVEAKNHLHLLNIGKWVKFANLRLEVHAGLWRGVITLCTRLRYIPHEDYLIVERQRLSYERLSLKSGEMLPCNFPEISCITEVYPDRAPHVTLMSVLTHPEVTAKFKCIVRVVAAMPCQSEKLRSTFGIYRMRLTLEDSTARIHAFIIAEDGETFFGCSPSIDNLTSKLNKLLGVAESDASVGVKDAPRNPPWVCVCIKSYYLSKTDKWGSRQFQILDTKIVGDA